MDLEFELVVQYLEETAHFIGKVSCIDKAVAVKDYLCDKLRIGHHHCDLAEERR